MKKLLLINLVLFFAATPFLLSQTSVSAPPIPEEARRHFVMGTALFKDAKSADDFSQVESEFKQAVDLAPNWPDARYNLALSKEAAGDYAGAMADLKLYLQFKLPDAEARTVQDKIYVLEAKSDVEAKKRAGEQQAAAAERAKAQQLLSAQRLMEYFRGNWDSYECYVGKISRPSLDRGCTGAEMGDNNNWDRHLVRGQLQIEDDGTVKVGQFLGCRGTSFAIPNGPGPSLSDIRWEIREEGLPPRQTWARISTNGKEFTVSCNRSPSSTDDSPYVYLWFERTP